MNDWRIYAVVGVALALGLLSYVLASDERHRWVELGRRDEAPYLARLPFVAALGAFLAAVVGGAIVVAAVEVVRQAA